jgi:hypothetical protein
VKLPISIWIYIIFIVVLGILVELINLITKKPKKSKCMSSYTECEYKSVCSAHQNNSHTCTDAVEKSYCGIYNQFLKDI